MSGRKAAIFTLGAIIVVSGISTNGAKALAVTPAKAKPKVVSTALGQLLQRGYEQMRKGNYDAAVATMAAAVRTDPDSVSARRYLAFALMRNGRSQEAMYQLLIIQRMAKASPFDNYTLGEAYVKVGKMEDAAACFKEALKTNPNYDPARASLIKTLSSTGNYDEAFSECLTGYKAAKTPMLSRYYRILYQNVQEQKLALHRMQDPSVDASQTQTQTQTTTVGQQTP